MFQWIELRSLGGIRKPQRTGRHKRHGTNSAPARSEPSPKLAKGVSEWRYNADACNRHAARRHEAAAFAANNFSIPSIISRTERIWVAASSGISILNSLSTANNRLMP